MAFKTSVCVALALAALPWSAAADDNSKRKTYFPRLVWEVGLQGMAAAASDIPGIGTRVSVMPAFQGGINFQTWKNSPLSLGTSISLAQGPNPMGPEVMQGAVWAHSRLLVPIRPEVRWYHKRFLVLGADLGWGSYSVHYNYLQPPIVFELPVFDSWTGPAARVSVGYHYFEAALQYVPKGPETKESIVSFLLGLKLFNFGGFRGHPLYL